MYDDTLKIFAGIDTDGVKSGMKDVKSLVDKGMSAVKSVTSAGASAISGVTKAVTASIAAAGSGVAAFGTYAATAGKTFEKSMSNVMATMGITKDTIQDGQNSYELLSATAKKMGETTKFSASEAGDALNYFALAGYDAKKACEALPAVLNLAQAGDMDLARTSDLATDAMSALGIEATNENLTHFGDVLAKTASSSNTSVAQLGEAMLVCGGQTRLAGMSLEQTATVLGILADNGIKSAEGGTALRNLLKNIYTPTSQASKAMEALGIQTSDADGNLRDVQDILLDTMSALEKLSEADKMTAMSDIFDVRTIAAASAALNNSSERYDELYAKIMDCNGAMEQMAETQNDNLEGDIYGLKSAFEAVGISVYEGMTLSLRKSVQLGTTYLRQLNDAFKKNGFDGLAEALGNKLGDAITKISAKIPDFINIGSDIVKSFMKGISNNSKILAKSASEIISSLANGILDLFPMFISVGGQLVSDFADGISGNLPVLAEKALNIVEWLYNGLIENLPKIINIALDLIEKFGNKILDNSDKIIYAGINIIKILADGIKKGIPKVLKVAKQVVKDFADALEKEIPALKPFAKVIKFVADNFEFLASTAVGVWVAFKGYTIITRVSKAVSLLGDAVKIASLTMLAHPLGTAFIALSGAAAFVGAVTFLTEEYKSETEKAIEKEKEYQDEINKSQREFENLQNNAKQQANKNLAPVERVSALAKELEHLADASGRVRDEDVERVNAILQTMNEVLGTDYTLVDNQIQKYDELKKSIDDVIEKKKAEILLDANAEPYEEAVKSYRNADADIVKQERKVQNQQQNVDNANISGFVMQDYYDYKEKGLATNRDGFYKWIEEVELLKTEQNTLKELNETADMYYKVIENYESALGAFESGNSEKAVEILEGRANSLKNAGNNIEASSAEYAVKMENARKTVEDAQITYNTHAEKLRNNVEGYTNSIIKDDKNTLAESRVAYYEMAIKAEKSGSTDFLNAMSESEKIGFENYSLVKKMEKIYENDKTQLAKLKEKYADTDSEVIKSGIEALERKIYDEQSSLNDIYMRSGISTAEAFGEGFTSEDRISSYVSSFASHINSDMDSQKEIVYKNAKEIGLYTGAGLSDGLNESIENVTNTCQNAVNAVTSSFQKLFEIHSPSRLMRDEVGKWLLPGIAVGIDDTVNQTADDMNNSINNLISQVDTPELSESGMFTQQIELLREFSPENNISQIADDERITEEIQSQLDEISVTLNADSFISQFQNILSNIGFNAVPQYSAVYNQIQSVPQNHESDKLEIPRNTEKSSPNFSIFIGDEEIKNFVVSTLNEANAVSGGASF